jgi:membrane protease YdiL (CAAX protease family)
MRLTIGILLLAVVLFVPLFITAGIGPVDFWWWMTVNLLILLTIVARLDSEWRRLLVADLKDHPARKAALGILSAGVLYLVFWFGDKICRYLLAGAANDISAVYAFKGQVPAIRIVLLMILVIGPGEELFWRGFLQRRFEDALGTWSGWLLAAGVYTAIHIASGNPILVLAAAVCGLFWGWLYSRYRSMALNAVSHTLWDIAVFVLFPFH